MGRRFRQKLFEVFQQVRCAVEKLCDLGIHILDWFGFALVCLQDFEELLVNLRRTGEAVLQGSLLLVVPLHTRRPIRALTFILFT